MSGDKGKSFRVVVLTTGGRYATHVVLELALRGIVPVVVVVSKVGAFALDLRASLVRAVRQPTSTAHALARRVVRLVRARVCLDEPCISAAPRLPKQLVTTGPRNSPEMVDCLRALRPDLVLLAQIGVLSDEVLQVPTLGTLNAHPGLLPFARGVGVVGRALQRAVPVAVSVHWVDAGIDTGRVVKTVLVPAVERDDLGTLGGKAQFLSSRMLAEVADDLTRGDVNSVQQEIRYPYCRWLSEGEIVAMEDRLRGGLAEALYQRWRDHYGSDVLPLDLGEHPPVSVEPVPMPLPD